MKPNLIRNSIPIFRYRSSKRWHHITVNSSDTTFMLLKKRRYLCSKCMQLGPLNYQRVVQGKDTAPSSHGIMDLCVSYISIQFDYPMTEHRGQKVLVLFSRSEGNNPSNSKVAGVGGYRYKSLNHENKKQLLRNRI